MRRVVFKAATLAVCLAAIQVALQPARAQESVEERLQRLEKQNDEIRKNAEVLKKQNEMLLRLLETSSNGSPVANQGAAPLAEDAVKNIVNSYLQEKESKQKGAEAAASVTQEGGYKVGTSLGMTATWRNGLVFETAHKDFYAHIGGWIQNDVVAFNQSASTLKTVGDLQDGDFFRRVRLQMDGGFWQVGEFNMIIGFENTQKSIVNVFELWTGLKDLPILGTVRIGRMWTPTGLEGDDTTSNKAMTFLERSSMSEAFYTQNFSTGIFQSNTLFDQRVSYQTMLYVPDIPGSNSGDFFGDGEYCLTGRMTGLPLYQCDGRQLIHLGGSATWRHATRGGNELADPQFVRFRARQEQRDFAGDIDGTTHDGAINPGDSNRFVDTGNIRADSNTILGTEFLMILGPASVQAEYAFSAANAAVVNGKSVGDQWFNGGYIQISYFLTGENRAYEKRFGRLSPFYLNGPTTPFWIVRDRDGGINHGLGAWEVAARFSHLDLNTSQVRGGEMDGLTLGLNWYLNPNLKIQFQYIHDNRYQTAPGVPSGWIDGFGIRTQFAF